jgi:hypothetical protein
MIVTPKELSQGYIIDRSAAVGAVVGIHGGKVEVAG